MRHGAVGAAWRARQAGLGGVSYGVARRATVRPVEAGYRKALMGGSSEPPLLLADSPLLLGLVEAVVVCLQFRPNFV